MLSAILECVVITAEAVATVGGAIKTVIDIFEEKDSVKCTMKK